MRDPFEFHDVSIEPGTEAMVELPIPNLYIPNPVSCPVYIKHGKKPGPVLFISGAIHGDEINGVEIVRRVIGRKAMGQINGTLIAIPVVNILGFINQTRYLPDRRDLNRSFPGSEHGSLAGRTANLFLQSVVSKCTHGIDLHTAAIHRDNFPQIRGDLANPEINKMAMAFSAPVVVNSEIAKGTLRDAASQLGVHVIVYEAGEALRFDEVSIRAGVKGVIATMRELGMLPKSKSKRFKPFVARSSSWVRAPASGILRASKRLGEKVEKNEILGIVSDPFGSNEEPVLASYKGIVIGRTNIPLVHEGEALFHIARFEDSQMVKESVEVFQDEMDPSTDTSPVSETPIV